MNPFLLVLVLLAGGTAYYEFNWQQQSSQGFQTQIQNWETQLEQLKNENKELTALKARLSQQAGPLAGRTSIEDLGTFTTITGKTYQDAKLLKIEATDIIINCTDGITQVAYAIMPSDLQKKFGWDPQKSSVANEATIRYQEQVEAAAADGANTAPPVTPPNPNLVPGMAPAPGTTNR